MYNKNCRIGPKTDPWGTPDTCMTGIRSEFSPSNATHCVRLNRKALIQFRIYTCNVYNVI